MFISKFTIQISVIFSISRFHNHSIATFFRCTLRQLRIFPTLKQTISVIKLQQSKIDATEKELERILLRLTTIKLFVFCCRVRKTFTIYKSDLYLIVACFNTTHSSTIFSVLYCSQTHASIDCYYIWLVV